MCCEIGTDTDVLLLSDHGSAPVSSALFVNKYLESNGLLAVKGPVKNKGDRYTKLRRWVLKNMPPGAVASIYKITPDFVSHKLTASAAIERTLQGLIDNVDWDKTLAFSTGGHQAHIYVNYDLVDKLKDDQPTQTVPDIVDKLCNMMSELTDPKTGEKLKPIFHFKNDTFSGPFQYEALTSASNSLPRPKRSKSIHGLGPQNSGALHHISHQYTRARASGKSRVPTSGKYQSWMRDF